MIDFISWILDFLDFGFFGIRNLEFGILKSLLIIVVEQKTINYQLSTINYQL